MEPGRQFYFGTYKNVHSYDKKIPKFIYGGIKQFLFLFWNGEGGRPGGKGMLRGQVVMEDAVADAPMVTVHRQNLLQKKRAGALQQDDQKHLPM
ncbi:MAG: hypothetical protein IPJ31_15330 [Bacteroidetes bacterium]|nr:hypothetical protein [Bacteroidota bacterium]